MGRPSNRGERRRQLIGAFARVLADHGYAGATIASVAAEAGVAPGLVHHHFESKAELMSGLVQDLLSRFRERIRRCEVDDTDRLLAYVDGALRLDDRSDFVAAKCWVGVFAEAVRSPPLFAQVRHMIDTEISAIRGRSDHGLSDQEAGGVLAFVIGSLVLGAFAPRKTAGFAAPGLRRFVQTLRQDAAAIAQRGDSPRRLQSD